MSNEENAENTAASTAQETSPVPADKKRKEKAASAPIVTSSDHPEATKIAWEKDSKLAFFKRLDAPYTIRPVHIANMPLRRMARRNFEFMSRNLFFISAFGRYLLGNGRAEDIIKAEDAARNTILNGIKSIKTKIAQAEHVLEQNLVKEEALYGRVETIMLPITSPGANLFINLLLEADKFYSLNFQLWSNGLIGNKEKFDAESNVRNDIKKVLAGVASQFGYILNKTREKDPEVAKKAGSAGDEAEASLTKAAITEVDHAAHDAVLGDDATSSSTVLSGTEVETKPTRKRKAAEPVAASA